MSIIENKKEYFVKADTYFFRRALTTGYEPDMFFGFNADATSSSERASNEKIQIWKTIKSFSVLYAVSKYERENMSNEYRISSLSDIYLKKYPTETDVDYLNIKKYDSPVRRKLLDILNSASFFGWVTSVENKIDMELFLFGNEKNRLIEFLGFADTSDEKLHDYNYFRKSNIIL
ncbi:MAG TPA: hypothetical protein PKZ75_09175 [Bacteroidia bacterium]|nr:hypothetical protein [Bacteroidia bacterium]